jgi:hypothetical protein
VDINLNPDNWNGYSDRNNDDAVFVPWNEKLTMFQKLCLIKTFFEEKVSDLLQ